MLELRVNNEVVLNKVMTFPIIGTYFARHPKMNVENVEVLYVGEDLPKPILVWNSSLKTTKLRFDDKAYDYPTTTSQEIANFFNKVHISTICYGSVDFFASRRLAKSFYSKAYSFSDGHEQERYESILYWMNENSLIAFDDNEDEYPYKK